MATLIKMPRLSLTMTEGVVTKWLKNEGEYVNKGEALAEIESDKATSVFESPEEGHVIKIMVPAGDTAECQTDICALGDGGEAYAPAAAAPPAAIPAQPKAAEETAPAAPVPAAPGARIFASPSARRVAGEYGVDLAQLSVAPGKARIEKKDVLAYLDAHKAKATPLARKLAETKGIDLSSLGKQPGQRIYSEDLTSEKSHLSEDKSRRREDSVLEDRVLKVTGMRKAIAARMTRSLQVAAHVSLTTEVDMTQALAARACILDEVLAKYGVKPSLNDVILKCVAAALRAHPRLNCVFDGERIIERADINLGVAVALEEGLVVPVIKRCDRLSIGAIALESKRLSSKAREQGLGQEDMADGTFTVSNLGAYGITQFTSIINQPESAILSVGQVVKRPAVTPDDDIVVQPRMNLTINFDHRPIDGAMAAGFLQTLRRYLEEPRLLLV